MMSAPARRSGSTGPSSRGMGAAFPQFHDAMCTERSSESGDSSPPSEDESSDERMDSSLLIDLLTVWPASRTRWSYSSWLASSP